MLELLAPAGNEESFFAAINNGADAVYLGLSDFSARKNAANFSVENLAYYVNYAHLFNAKVYVAVNTLGRIYRSGRIFRQAFKGKISRYNLAFKHAGRSE